MEELIARLRKATGPDRILDDAIWKATGHDGGFPPTYTASVDDALTLIDLADGWMPHIDADWRRGTLWWEVRLGHMAYDATEDVRHTSLPIALCIVALRARTEAGDRTAVP